MHAQNVNVLNADEKRSSIWRERESIGGITCTRPGSREICLVTHVLIFCKIKLKYLKSLGPIDRKFHGHYKNDGFFFNEYKIKQFSSFCKYANISVMKKKIKENNMSTVNRKCNVYG